MSEFEVNSVAGKISVARINQPRKYDPVTGKLISTVIILDDPEDMVKLAAQILSEYVNLKRKEN